MEKNGIFFTIVVILGMVLLIGGVYAYQKHETNILESRTITGNASCECGGKIEFKDLYGTGTCGFYADFIIWPSFKKAVLDVPGVNVVFDSDSQYGFTIRMADRFFSSNKVYNSVALKLCTLQARELRGDAIWRLRR